MLCEIPSVFTRQIYEFQKTSELFRVEIHQKTSDLFMVEKSQTCLTCMNSVVKHAHGSQNESYVYILTMAISNKAGGGTLIGDDDALLFVGG